MFTRSKLLVADREKLEEVYELLSNHYVEDDEAMFRFNYSVSFLNWYGKICSAYQVAD